MRANDDIRERARERRVHLYEIAFVLGVNDGNFSRRLRRELSDDERKEIFSIIDQLAGDKTGEAHV